MTCFRNGRGSYNADDRIRDPYPQLDIVLVVGDRKDYSVLVYNATSSGISLARFVNDQVT